jgi:DNA-directed RNA polymerase specialized sigma24 family protein
MGKWELTQEAFEKLLGWLNQDREQAGRKYEAIRHKLVFILTCRGCICPEDLADEAINRVTRKLPEIIDRYTGDPSLYFYDVAHKIHLEYCRRKPDPVLAPVPDPPQEQELQFECLEECMKRLTSRNRDLVLEYYLEEKQAKIDRRRELANQLGIAANALRIRAHHIRATLQDCVFECIKQTAAG